MILDVLKRIDAGEFTTAGEARHGEWEVGWKENFDELVRSNYDLGALVPKYIRPYKTVRLFGDYVRPATNFVRDYTAVFRAWIAHRYLRDAEFIYEFGCGSGQHLAYLAQAFPEATLIGFDWAEVSVQILDALAERFGWRLSGKRFDLFSPDSAITLPPNTVVLTYGALEQIGNRWSPFLQYLLEERPARCVHIEPLAELYDENILLDYLALRYHRKRGYLNGFLSALRDLVRQGRVVIEREFRHSFGTTFAETYSYVVWRPRAA